MDADLERSTAAARTMYNHCVHGVMDFAAMLRRRRRAFEIIAGHDADPRTLDRAADHVRAVVASAMLRNSRVLRVGDAFAGMGAFFVTEDVLADKVGIGVRQISLDAFDEAIGTVTSAAVARAMSGDRERFACEFQASDHERSVRVGLGRRHLIETGVYSGFSVKLQAFARVDRPADIMPFLEISSAMGRGIGYAGEGDVLTAALVGALARAFSAVTFTEVFCADWAGDLLFLWHMGEISPAVAGDIPRIISKPIFGGGSLDPAKLTCAVKPCPAVLGNLAPDRTTLRTYRLTRGVTR